MLLWRPSERNKYIFLFELIIISAIAHGILGILLFVVYKSGVSSFHIELGKSHSPTLFVPLKRPSMFNHAGCSAQGRPGVRRKGSVARGTKSFELTNDAPTKIAQAKRGTTMGLEAEHIVKKDAHIKKKANKKTKKRSTKQAMFTQKKT